MWWFRERSRGLFGAKSRDFLSWLLHFSSIPAHPGVEFQDGLAWKLSGSPGFSPGSIFPANSSLGNGWRGKTPGRRSWRSLPGRGVIQGYFFPAFPSGFQWIWGIPSQPFGMWGNAIKFHPWKCPRPGWTGPGAAWDSGNVPAHGMGSSLNPFPAIHPGILGFSDPLLHIFPLLLVFPGDSHPHPPCSPWHPRAARKAGAGKNSQGEAFHGVLEWFGWERTFRNDPIPWAGTAPSIPGCSRPAWLGTLPQGWRFPTFLFQRLQGGQSSPRLCFFPRLFPFFWPLPALFPLRSNLPIPFLPSSFSREFPARQAPLFSPGIPALIP
ncbi:uncharacterized protein LOC131378462 [Hirundo rustica]|uniref:uncharacterized protein LOC131378462 n=1 Tax=Hirundo rustica TaxID=43150 RepID=UPI001A95039F|nr:uncharacterized protein LOC131378462 [Hirundo rustica]